MVDTAVYVGAGNDITPILIFKYITTFIYIDSQPLTEFGGTELFPGCERPEFPLQIYEILINNGFIKANNKTENLHEYYNSKTKCSLRYYMNCCFPKDLSQALLNDIKMSNILICCGYVPSAVIISMMKPGIKTFIGNNITCYNIKLDEEDYFTVVQALRETPSLISKYIRFDIPKIYLYGVNKYTEETHNSGFVVTSYKSIQDLYKCKLK